MSATREQVVTEALSWVGTPFHHGIGIKGRGVDCAYLPVRVFCGLGLVEAFDPGIYPSQWYLHHDEPRYLNWVEKYAHRVDGWGLPGDLHMFNFGRHAAHGGIVIVPGVSMVHAYGPVRKVIADDPKRFANRFHGTYSVF